MGLTTNLTSFATAELAGKDANGRPLFVSIVKATFTWNAEGTAELAPSVPVIAEDVYAGEPSKSGLLRASEIGHAKTKVDVILAGEIVFPVPIEHVEVGFDVGSRITKRAVVWGARTWLPGLVAELVPSGPTPVTKVPIAWEHSFGGSDATDSKFTELRNPVGSGMARTPQDLAGKPAPHFDEPSQPLQSWRDRPKPCGFGAIAPHWQPRAKRAGTFDERWTNERSPLLPKDFNPLFFNVAPDDQQLDDYIPGEEVRLLYLTKGVRERFLLPHFNLPIAIATPDVLIEDMPIVDTIIIEPAQRRFSIIGRVSIHPKPDASAVRQVIVGKMSAGRRRALESGKTYGLPGASPLGHSRGGL